MKHVQHDLGTHQLQRGTDPGCAVPQPDKGILLSDACLTQQARTGRLKLGDRPYIGVHDALTRGLLGIDHHGLDFDPRTVSILGLFQHVTTVELSDHHPSWCRLRRRQGFERLFAKLRVPLIADGVAIIRKQSVKFCA